MKKIILLLLAYFYIPSLPAQEEWQEIIESAIQINESYIDRTEIQQQIVKYTADYYTSKNNDSPLINRPLTIVRLASQYFQLGIIDSAYHYIELYRFIQGYPPLKGDHYWSDLQQLIDERMASFKTPIEKKKPNNYRNIDTPFTKAYKKNELSQEYLNSILRKLHEHTKHGQEIRKLISNFQKYKTKHLKKILAESGIPLIAEHGIFATNGFLNHLKKHAPDVLISRTDELERLGLQKKIDGSIIASIIDQKLILEGKKQRYGTQFTRLFYLKTFTPYPIEDEENIDARRKAIGFQSSLEEEIERLEKANF